MSEWTKENWAEKEVEIACKKEIDTCKNAGEPEEEAKYGIWCYESALKAYNAAMKSLGEDGHSGFSYGITKGIIERLLNKLPLTPIEDAEDIWQLSWENNSDGSHTYQCKRKSSLFKKVHSNGDVTFDDVDRVACVDDNYSKVPYGSSLVGKIINKKFPITMPYYLAKDYIVVHCISNMCGAEEYSKKLVYCVMPDGEKVKLNKYLVDGKETNWLGYVVGSFVEKRKLRKKYDKRTNS